MTKYFEIMFILTSLHTSLSKKKKKSLRTLWLFKFLVSICAYSSGVIGLEKGKNQGTTETGKNI